MQAGAAQDRAAGEERAALAARVQELEGQLAAQVTVLAPLATWGCSPPALYTQQQHEYPVSAARAEAGRLSSVGAEDSSLLHSQGPGTGPPQRGDADADAAALQAAVTEYREKLRGAVRKGKTIEAERQRLVRELEEVRGALRTSQVRRLHIGWRVCGADGGFRGTRGTSVSFCAQSGCWAAGMPVQEGEF